MDVALAQILKLTRGDLRCCLLTRFDDRNTMLLKSFYLNDVKSFGENPLFIYVA